MYDSCHDAREDSGVADLTVLGLVPRQRSGEKYFMLAAKQEGLLRHASQPKFFWKHQYFAQFQIDG